MRMIDANKCCSFRENCCNPYSSTLRFSLSFLTVDFLKIFIRVFTGFPKRASRRVLRVKMENRENKKPFEKPALLENCTEPVCKQIRDTRIYIYIFAYYIAYTLLCVYIYYYRPAPHDARIASDEISIF